MAKIACPYCYNVQIFDDEQKSCKECGQVVSSQFIKSVTKTPPIYLATAGFTQHGKTTYLDSMMTMIENLGKISDRTYYEYMDDYTFSKVQEMRYQVQQRDEADSTPVSQDVQPLLIGIHNFLDLPVHPVVLYDLGGEVFDRNADIQKFAKPMMHAHTIWFFVSVYDLENPSDVVSRGETFIRSLSDLFAVYRNGMERLGVSLKGRNLLIVYTKADKVVNQLPSAVRNYIRSDKYFDLVDKKRSEARQLGIFDPDTYLTEMLRISDELREWTYDIEGGTPFIHMLEESGMNVVFTATSSIGRESSRETNRMIEFRRYRVLDPLLWALMHNLAIGGDRSIALILDSSEEVEHIYSSAQDIPYHTFNYLSGKGNVTTYYLGQSSSVSRAGARPPEVASEIPRPSLIGPILDNLDDNTIVVVILDRPNHSSPEDAILDIEDYDIPKWQNRIGVFAFQDGIVSWKRYAILNRISRFNDLFDELFPRLDD
jgi:hypothetical protein